MNEVGGSAVAAQRSISVNGVERRVAAPDATPLLAVLRDEFDLRSARFGCGHEQCGACMVLVDGVPRYSCTLQVGEVGDRAVVTVEGLGTRERPHPIQTALIDGQAGQCGYCLSGIQISAAALLARDRAPSRREIVEALEPHLCRCGAHNRIVRAVECAARAMAGADA
ncbi:(2Fe-2S)-binding protein [Lichenibacterium dinghuense]|uniref:(2Fe-2S)-binding protein n=1 Tax=Lichenibacterium dinghuense TaxID=2895977 RepID=UPI001F342C09|nr:2Fe-2S iron-sulfur cluster-binding protein [Lichenibacterium sp. 6Y81]